MMKYELAGRTTAALLYVSLLIAMVAQSANDITAHDNIPMATVDALMALVLGYGAAHNIRRVKTNVKHLIDNQR